MRENDRVAEFATLSHRRCAHDAGVMRPRVCARRRRPRTAERCWEISQRYAFFAYPWNTLTILENPHPERVSRTPGTPPACAKRTNLSYTAPRWSDARFLFR